MGQSETPRERAKGTVYVEVRVEQRQALSRALEGWTDAEVQGLLDGEQEAYDALKDQMLTDALKHPDDCEIVFCDLRIGDRKVDLDA